MSGREPPTLLVVPRDIYHRAVVGQSAEVAGPPFSPGRAAGHACQLGSHRGHLEHDMVIRELVHASNLQSCCFRPLIGAPTG